MSTLFLSLKKYYKLKFICEQQFINVLIFSVHNERLTRITLSHNKLNAIPPNISDLVNLEYLNLWNNQIDELPTSISSLPNLKILNVGLVLPFSNKFVQRKFTMNFKNEHFFMDLTILNKKY